MIRKTTIIKIKVNNNKNLLSFIEALKQNKDIKEVSFKYKQ